jgi:3-oxoacyl-[acyl-carrier protein] reductase
MDLGLSERACVVAGASRGVGRATALALAAEGASLLLLARGERALAEVSRTCEELGGRAEILALDITAANAGDLAVQRCLERFGRLDALVNNAGTTSAKDLEMLTDEDWQTQWELHVMAPMRLMRAAVPSMSERRWGRIVNVSSSSGKRPGQRNVAYSVTKAAVLSLSRAFADRYAREGVLVNSITPGPIATDLWVGSGGLADQVARQRGTTREQVLESVAAGIPLGRLATEHEIAMVIVFLCSEAAAYITGAAWSVDGGAVPVII